MKRTQGQSEAIAWPAASASGLANRGLATGARSLPGWAAVSGGCLLLTLAAQVRIPIPGTDVPMTLQTLAVLLIGLTFPPRRAVGAVLLYLGLGVAGLPVYALGPGGVAGPTGGYLVGFLAAVWLISSVCGGRTASYARLAASAGAGTAVVFILGLAWRIVLFPGDLATVAATGFLPFGLKALVQVPLSASVVTTWRSLGRGRSG